MKKLFILPFIFLIASSLFAIDFSLDMFKDCKIIFDEGYNLSDKTKFDELITKQISEIKTEILKILFEYNG